MLDYEFIEVEGVSSNIAVHTAWWNGLTIFGSRFTIINEGAGTANCILSIGNRNSLLWPDYNDEALFFTSDGSQHFHQELYPWKFLFPPILSTNPYTVNDPLAGSPPIRLSEMPHSSGNAYYEQPDYRWHPSSNINLTSGLTPNQRALDRNNNIDWNKPASSWPPFKAYGNGVTTSATPQPHGPINLFGRPAADYYQLPDVYELKPYSLTGHKMEIFIFWTGDLRYNSLYTGRFRIDPHLGKDNKFTPFQADLQLNVVDNNVESVDFVNIEDISILDRIFLKGQNVISIH